MKTKAVARVTVYATERFAEAFPTSCGAEVHVFLRNGAMTRNDREHVKGDPAATLTETKLITKSVGLIARSNVENPKRIIDEVLAMQHGRLFPGQELRRTLGECK